jgi:uncharacterized metal-binding protein YceD (DUF177 family)
MSAPPEFGRPIRIDRIGAGDRAHHIEANEAERAALARRFGFVRIDALAADYTLHAAGGGWEAHGTLHAALVQPCTATGEDVPETVDTSFAIRFLPATAAPQGDELELDEEDCDVQFVEGGEIDIGEAVAQTLALAVDSYPRVAGAESWLRARGVLSEDEAKAAASPFAALQGLAKGG